MEFLHKNWDDVVSVGDIAEFVTSVMYFSFTASEGQTVFTGLDDNGRSLLVPGTTAQVYVNQSRMIQGSQFTLAPGGDTVTMTSPLAAGDKVRISAFGFNADGSIYQDPILAQDSLVQTVLDVMTARDTATAAAAVAVDAEAVVVTARDDAEAALADLLDRYMGSYAAPPAAASVGAIYFNSTDNALYVRTSLGTWVTTPAGPMGPEGPEGPEGPVGLPGEKWHYGTDVPADVLGNVGDWYLRSNGDISEKTAVDTWNLRFNIVGPQGPQGIQGVPGDEGPVGPIGPAGPAGADSGVFDTLVILTTSQDWMVPAGVVEALVLIAGGGGGGAGWNSSDAGATGGTGGWGGLGLEVLTLTPGTVMPAVIGAGGAGTNANTAGAAGGTTTFGGLSSTGGYGAQYDNMSRAVAGTTTAAVNLLDYYKKRYFVEALLMARVTLDLAVQVARCLRQAEDRPNTVSTTSPLTYSGTIDFQPGAAGVGETSGGGSAAGGVGGAVFIFYKA